jgi:hypothetical protein
MPRIQVSRERLRHLYRIPFRAFRRLNPPKESALSVSQLDGGWLAGSDGSHQYPRGRTNEILVALVVDGGGSKWPKTLGHPINTRPSVISRHAHGSLVHATRLDVVIRARPSPAKDRDQGDEAAGDPKRRPQQSPPLRSSAQETVGGRQLQRDSRREPIGDQVKVRLHLPQHGGSQEPRPYQPPAALPGAEPSRVPVAVGLGSQGPSGETLIQRSAGPALPARIAACASLATAGRARPRSTGAARRDERSGSPPAVPLHPALVTVRSYKCRSRAVARTRAAVRRRSLSRGPGRKIGIDRVPRLRRSRAHACPLPGLWASSTMRLNLNSGQVGKCRFVGSHDGAAYGPCGGGDDQVVRAPGPSLASDMYEQLGMDLRDCTVVVEDGNDLQDVAEEGNAGGTVLARGQEHTNSQLGCGDSGHRNLVVIGDGVVEGLSRSFGVDEKGRVEEKPGQVRSSISTTDRTAARSCDQSVSGRCRRSSSFTSAPWPSVIGSRLAIALPRRTIVKRSPRCSTASRRSAKRRAASVAVISATRSDYQIRQGGVDTLGHTHSGPRTTHTCPAYRAGRSAARSVVMRCEVRAVPGHPTLVGVADTALARRVLPAAASSSVRRCIYRPGETP